MLNYLRDHIVEEIDGANDYMHKAVEHRGTMCGEQFAGLASVELRHANTLYDMFRHQEKPNSMPDKEYSILLKDILDKFSDGMKNYEALKKLYYMK